MKAIKRLYDSSAGFQNLKPVYDGLQKIKLEKPRAKYKRCVSETGWFTAETGGELVERNTEVGSKTAHTRCV